MTGWLKDLTLNRDGTQNITITVNSDFRNSFDELKEKEVTVEIKRFSKRRSLDANAYAWVLIDKIAEKMKLKKTEVYRNCIKDIGGVSTIICVKNEAVESLCHGWETHGIGWQYETMQSKIEGCTNVILWYGSSVYDSAQMATFIQNLIQDAEDLGIPTITPEEQSRLIEQWKMKYGEG